MLGEYPDEPVASYIYGVVLIAVTLMRVAMYWYVARRPALLWDQAVITRRRLVLALAAAPLPVYVLAMAIAGVAPVLSVVLFFAVPGLYFLLITMLRDRPGTSHEADEFS